MYRVIFFLINVYSLIFIQSFRIVIAYAEKTVYNSQQIDVQHYVVGITLNCTRKSHLWQLRSFSTIKELVAMPITQ